MKANYLNQAFNPAQARAVEKYVEAALAEKRTVKERIALSEKPNLLPSDQPALAVTEKKPKAVIAPAVTAKPESTEE